MTAEGGSGDRGAFGAGLRGCAFARKSGLRVGAGSGVAEPGVVRRVTTYALA